MLTDRALAARPTILLHYQANVRMTNKHTNTGGSKHI